jgi:hypothetical protein
MRRADDVTAASGYHGPSLRCALPAPRLQRSADRDQYEADVRATSTMNTRSHLDNPASGPLDRGRSRRAFVRVLVAGAGASTVGMLIAACGPAEPVAVLHA